MKTYTFPEVVDYYGNLKKIDWAETTSASNGYQLPINSETKALLSIADDKNDPTLKHIIKHSYADLYKTIVDMLYPVGSVYLSVSPAVNPNTQFPGTSWARINAGYLYAADTDNSYVGDNQPAGDTTFTTEHMPTHNHEMAHIHGGEAVTVFGSAVFDLYSSLSDTGEATKILIENEDTTYEVSTSPSATQYFKLPAQSRKAAGTTVSIDFTHSHAIKTTSISSNYTKFSGSSKAFMPAYYAVIVWKRTA